MFSLRLENISKDFKSGDRTIHALKNVSYTFFENESVAIIGPSGSGKSTLLNIAGLILNANQGKIYIDDTATENLSDSQKCKLRNQYIGYIAQDFALINDETVYKNIQIPLLYNKKIGLFEHRKRITEIAKELGIADKLKRKVNKLSGGERQRVAIARALVCDQKIILADEPTGSLDSENKDLVIELLTFLCKRKGLLLIIVTHDLSISQQCDKIIKLVNGAIET